MRRSRRRCRWSGVEPSLPGHDGRHRWPRERRAAPGWGRGFLAVFLHVFLHTNRDALWWHFCNATSVPSRCIVYKLLYCNGLRRLLRDNGYLTSYALCITGTLLPSQASTVEVLTLQTCSAHGYAICIAVRRQYPETSRRSYPLRRLTRRLRVDWETPRRRAATLWLPLARLNASL